MEELWEFVLMVLLGLFSLYLFIVGLVLTAHFALLTINFLGL